SASNIHLTPFQERFAKYTPYAEPQDIIGLGGMTTQAFGTGTVILHDRQQRKHMIQDVVYVPKAQFPILSLFKLQLDISFSNDSIHLSDHKTASLYNQLFIPMIFHGFQKGYTAQTLQLAHKLALTLTIYLHPIL